MADGPMQPLYDALWEFYEGAGEVNPREMLELCVFPWLAEHGYLVAGPEGPLDVQPALTLAGRVLEQMAERDADLAVLWRTEHGFPAELANACRPDQKPCKACNDTGTVYLRSGVNDWDPIECPGCT